MIRFFYNVFVVPVLWAGFRLLAIRDEKARLILFRQGTIFSDLEKKLNEFPLKKKRVLFHVSSVGEYLQARPLILKLKEKLTDTAFILSFLSPSLEGQLERNRAADIETYLPLDTPGSVRRFLELLRPDLIVFSTYDVWPNLLWQAKDRGIPALLVNASLAENSGRLNPAARWFFRSVYKGLSAVGAISEHDGKRLKLLGILDDRMEVTGNCRFDQTMERARNVSADDPVLEHLPKDKIILVAGSTWPEDEEKLLSAFSKLSGEFSDLIMIMAPHEPVDYRISDLLKDFSEQGIPCIELNRLDKKIYDKEPPRAILVNGVGYLFKLYKIGAIAFIGGSFGRAVHNVMEPAAFGLPVIFGPRHQNSHEALLMKERGGAFAVSSSFELEDRLRLLIQGKDARVDAGEKAREVVEDNLGATGRTASFIFNRFPWLLK